MPSLFQTVLFFNNKKTPFWLVSQRRNVIPIQCGPNVTAPQQQQGWGNLKLTRLLWILLLYIHFLALHNLCVAWISNFYICQHGYLVFCVILHAVCLFHSGLVKDERHLMVALVQCTYMDATSVDLINTNSII